jgi:hypothetical protein
VIIAIAVDLCKMALLAKIVKDVSLDVQHEAKFAVRTPRTKQASNFILDQNNLLWIDLANNSWMPSRERLRRSN